MRKLIIVVVLLLVAMSGTAQEYLIDHTPETLWADMNEDEKTLFTAGYMLAMSSVSMFGQLVMIREDMRDEDYWKSLIQFTDYSQESVGYVLWSVDKLLMNERGVWDDPLWWVIPASVGKIDSFDWVATDD